MQEFAQGYAVAICDGFLTYALVGPEEVEDAFHTQPRDAERCAEWARKIEGVGQPEPPAWVDAVEAGSPRTSPERAEACLASVRFICPYEYIDVDALDPCAAVVVGLRAEGDPSDEPIHCAPGTYCTKRHASLCGGTCAPAAALGEPRRSTPECGDPSRR